MDWIIPAITAAAGLGGAWIMGHFNVKAQRVAQASENLRHARKIAFETAMKDWEGMREFLFWRTAREENQRATGRESAPPYPMPVLEDYVIHHLALTEEFARIDLGTATADDIIAVVKHFRARSFDVHTFRRKFEQELRDAHKPVRCPEETP